MGIKQKLIKRRAEQFAKLKKQEAALSSKISSKNRVLQQRRKLLEERAKVNALKRQLSAGRRAKIQQLTKTTKKVAKFLKGFG